MKDQEIPALPVNYESGGKSGQLADPVVKKKKKRSKRPKSKRGLNKPTGFEEYYVDAPMTPEEYEVEKGLYNVSRPLIHRIEYALLRYQNKRRIEPDRREVFLKYLAYGGVDISPKMFQGTDDRELQDMDNEQILLARGQTSIKSDQSKLAVDFNAVVKGYLTSYFPYYFNPESEDMIKLATVTIRNFLSYLLYHDVCPEHKENIDEARRSCDIATKDLWKNQLFTANGPGDFNTACSTLFGGFRHDIYMENNQWESPKGGPAQMAREVAQKVLKVGLASSGSDELAILFTKLAIQEKLEAHEVEDIHGFEVTEIYPSDHAALELYAKHSPDLRPVGKLFGRAYRDPGKPAYDLTPQEHDAWEHSSKLVDEFEFFLEDDLLQYCYPGMKVITPVWKVSCGFHYFEAISTAYSSIYTVLANDLMLGWKKPRKVGLATDDENSDLENGSEGFL